MTPAIELTGIGRSFGRPGTEVTVLRDVTFDVAPGEIVALLGGNGAGKTTLLKILSTVLSPDRGSARICGFDVVADPRRARAALGVSFGGDRGLYGRLSARDNLRYFGMLHGVGRRALRSRIPDLLEQLHLSEVARRRVETFSKGMRQRLHLAIGLLAEPAVLLLDEPTVGLDLFEAQNLRTTVLALRDRGVAVLLTSHYLLDIERLAERVVLLHDGTVDRVCRLSEFGHRAGQVATVTVRGAGPAPDLTRLPAGLPVPAVRRDADGWEVDVCPAEWSADVFTQLGHLFAGAAVRDVRVESANLEDTLTSLVGRGPR